MLKITSKKIVYFFCLAVLVFAFLLAPPAYKSLRWRQAAEAAEEIRGLPYPIGLTNIKIMNCILVKGACTGGEWCHVLDAGRCILYSEVSGTPAGGMGFNALFNNIAIKAVGLTDGGQLIAGGMSPVAMDNGVLASAGGCYGCGLAKAGLTDKFFSWLDKYIIAGLKEKWDY